jgi:Trypsin-co-occurring domain 1
MPLHLVAMSEITEIELADGQIVYARVTSAPGVAAGAHGAAHDVGFGEVIPKLATGQVVKLIDSAVGTVREAVRHYDADEVSIDIGVELAAQTGRVIGVLAEVGGTASVVVHLTWRKPEKTG